MADTRYKVATLANLVPHSPTLGQLAPLTPSRWAPFRQVMAAQDASLAGTRRIIGKWTLSGSLTFHVPEDQEPGSGPSQDLPDIAGYRTVDTIRCRQTPGAMLEAHFVYVPSGQTENLDGSNWEPAGPLGELRLRATWTGTATSPQTDFTALLEPYPNANSDLPDQQAGVWQILEEKIVPNIRPANYVFDNATATDYAERVDVELVVQVRGAVRPVCLIVYELPLAQVQEHNDAGPFSAHAVGNLITAQTPKPQIAAADGTTYDEDRFGTYRTIDAAAEQRSTLVPRIAHWGPWDEGSQDFTATEVAPVATSSTTFVGVPDVAITTWGLENPGFAVAASHALPHHYNDAGLILRNEDAVVPVRVRVNAEWTTGGGTYGLLRFQTGPYEWIDIRFTSSGTRETLDAYGDLNSQIWPDHHGGNLQVFALVENASDVLEIYGWAVDMME